MTTDRCYRSNRPRRRIALLMLVVFGGIGRQSAVAQTEPERGTYDLYPGNYQAPDGRVIGIDRFDMDGGQTTLLYSHYASGGVRRMFPAGHDQFEIGPSFGIATPIELTIRFIRNERLDVVAALLQAPGKPEIIAKRLSLTAEPVSFHGHDAILAGTLLIPGNKGGPRAAIILLHGSGRLGRYSFGPYPHFFTSLGLAVLVYDKRASGFSTGTYLPRTAYYPEDFLRDALAAVDFLRRRSDIDPKRVGLWGTSEGGMLTTQVAARSKNVAFIINSSGFMTPLWQQVLYNIEAQLRADGFSAVDVAEAVTFEKLAIDTMRTGQGWEEFNQAQSVAHTKKWFLAYFGQGGTFSSLENLRWQWDHVYSFDPLPALRSIGCPVLGLFGALDTSTPVIPSEANLRRILSDGRNPDVTLVVFPNANHPLMEAHTGGNAEIPTLKGEVSSVFATLSSWILARTGPTANQR